MKEKIKNGSVYSWGANIFSNGRDIRNFLLLEIFFLLKITCTLNCFDEWERILSIIEEIYVTLQQYMGGEFTLKRSLHGFFLNRLWRGVVVVRFQRNLTRLVRFSLVFRAI